MKHILSLGAGVQSSTLALLAAHGEIGPMPDAAIFADTQAEPRKVYEWLAWLRPQLPFPVLEVTKGNLATRSLEIQRSKKSGRIYQKHMVPLFLRSDAGKLSMLGRRCTEDYKILQIVKSEKLLVGGATAIRTWRKGHSQRVLRTTKRRGKIREEWLWERRAGSQGLLTSWIGISTDESDRMKPSKEDWIETRWPLIELGLTRADCLAWMRENGYPEPPRSACVFCPYHGDVEWIRLRDEEPEEFARAVEWEQQVQARHAQQEVTTGTPFLHRKMIPLGEVVFDPTQKRSQFGNECAGICGV